MGTLRLLHAPLPIVPRLTWSGLGLGFGFGFAFGLAFGFGFGLELRSG